MTRNIFTIKTTASELRAIVDALISAELDAEGEAWISGIEAKKYPTDALTSISNERIQARYQQIRHALNSLYDVVYSVRDEKGNWVNVMNDDAVEEIA